MILTPVELILSVTLEAELLYLRIVPVWTPQITVAMHLPHENVIVFMIYIHTNKHHTH